MAWRHDSIAASVPSRSRTGCCAIPRSLGDFPHPPMSRLGRSCCGNGTYRIGTFGLKRAYNRSEGHMVTKGELAAALVAIAFLLFGPVSACAFMPPTAASGHPCCPEKPAPPQDCTGQSCCAMAPAAPSAAVLHLDEWSTPFDFAQLLLAAPAHHEALSTSAAITPPGALERYLTFHQLLV